MEGFSHGCKSKGNWRWYYSMYHFYLIPTNSGVQMLPMNKNNLEVNRLLLTWFTSVNMKQFSPEKFPIFVRMTEDINLFGVPTLDGSMVKIAPVGTR